MHSLDEIRSRNEAAYLFANRVTPTTGAPAEIQDERERANEVRQKYERLILALSRDELRQAWFVSDRALAYHAGHYHGRILEDLRVATE